MQANTLHFVITLEHSICWGGHFYAISMIQDICYRVFHSFVSGMLITNLITNTKHTLASCQLLCRMLAFYHKYLVLLFGMTDPPPIYGSLFILLFHFDINRYHFFSASQKAHLPDLKTFDGLKDIIVLCSIIEPRNILSSWSYHPSPNEKQEQERMIYACRHDCRLIMWVFYLYKMLDEHGCAVADAEWEVYWQHVEQQACILCHSRNGHGRMGSGAWISLNACQPMLKRWSGYASWVLLTFSPISIADLFRIKKHLHGWDLYTRCAEDQEMSSQGLPHLLVHILCTIMQCSEECTLQTFMMDTPTMTFSSKEQLVQTQESASQSLLHIPLVCTLEKIKTDLMFVVLHWCQLCNIVMWGGSFFL